MKKISILIIIIGAFFFNEYGAKNKIWINTRESDILEEIQAQVIVDDVAPSESLGMSIVFSDEKLVIDSHKCIGCGKCTVVAPNNFKMNFNTRLAEVISQNNIAGAEVSRAIKICPARAISI